MTTLPIPFVVAFLLVILAASNHLALKETPTGRLFGLILYMNAFGMMLVGIRWAWDVLAVLPVVATLTVTSSALLYLAFISLGRSGPVISVTRDWYHGIPALLVILSVLFAPQWIDLWLITTKVVYCVLLMQLAYRYPTSFQLVRLSWLNNTRQALWAAAFLQLNSLVVDIAITLDFMFYEGRHAANLVGMVSLMILFLLGYAAVYAGRGRVISQPATNDPPQATADVAAVEEPDAIELMDRLNTLLVDDKLYADTELNLQRFARKAGIPARTLSRTVNTQTGQNLSQWVNQARINAVCRLLENPDKSISDAMFEAGFITKSNFNREFRRIKGCSPSEWRDKADQQA